MARSVLVTGANGYIGNAVARAFVRAGWITYGLIRSPASASALAGEEIIPVVGAIDDPSSHEIILANLPVPLDAIVSTTEVTFNYLPHYTNLVTLVRTLAQPTVSSGAPKPLLLFTSGCKDYGVGPHIHGAPDLVPHTEESPRNPPPPLAGRAENAARIFDHEDLLAPVLLRPTNVYGRSSSFYAGFFQVASQVAAAGTENSGLIVPADPNYVLHALHVDDCADAYVALAEHPRRDEVAGQVFNVSAHRYETVDQVVRALVQEYGIKGGLKYVRPDEIKPEHNPWPPFLIDFPQWTGSDKLRRVTGWRDRRTLFSEALHVYRLAYEAATANDLTAKMQDRVASVFKGFKAN
ncbi:NAD dependent epimerase/dehydratase [Sodiomyces alkalinus F11]|uniref:NAD dependent epimerase/dehydratase n=1 Tax=Sodiomyces alkalinus (strain CBS 110278 / VKM F-3762 / F11) TaxID=1314773 RepID=A0A3N2Q6U8_SODAK|nr:NAD dependent epimerase/dehydratase [Sodiomyces alkalinus F11]ROT42388.1 NAD dependent epimerase/dehydratase [Sodiomyces alkalinus F11]